MIREKFFDESTAQSKMKALLVSKYFQPWAKVMVGLQKRYPHHTQRIAYIDLFAGPGRYKDGASSTPLLILETALKNCDISERLVTIFNDKDENHVETLQREIGQLEGANKLKYSPIFMNIEVGEQIAEEFSKIKLVPTLFFVDPWGYKGLSIDLLYSLLKDFGSDGFFFFNYNRINMGLNNPKIEDHMISLFGQDRLKHLQDIVQNLDPTEKEFAIVNEIGMALKALGAKFVLPFRFKNDRGTRTSHHLFFVSKHVLGYTIMKEIMACHSSDHFRGVASFEFNPVTNRNYKLLFDYNQTPDNLPDSLLRSFAGQTLTIEQVFSKNHIGTPFVKSNYKSAVLLLEEEGKVTLNPPRQRRRKYKGNFTVGEKVKISFPE